MKAGNGGRAAVESDGELVATRVRSISTDNEIVRARLKCKRAKETRASDRNLA